MFGLDCFTIRRSREGAWIEIDYDIEDISEEISRSREGAWIEIKSYKNCKVSYFVAPARERGLKSPYIRFFTAHPAVAPARERGLKLYC